MGSQEWACWNGTLFKVDLWLRLAKIISGVMALVADPDAPPAGLRETDTSHIPFSARGCSVHGVSTSPQIHEERKQKYLKMRSIMLVLVLVVVGQKTRVTSHFQFEACPSNTIND